MIDPRTPDYSNTPADPRRPGFEYAARPRVAGADSDGPVVSVITPFFNPGAAFAQTARTVFGQSLQRFEWIIVNDASTDPASLAALDAARSDPRVRVIDLATNRGPSHARNVAFREARCAHVYQLDADDLIEPTTIEKQLWAALCQPNYAFFNAFLVGFGGIEYLWTEGFQSTHMITTRNPLSTHALISKAAFETIGGYDESITGGLEDWEFWLRAASKGFWGATIPEFQSWYRRRASHSDRWENWDSSIKQSEFLEKMAGAHPELFGGKLPYVEPLWPRAYEDVRAAPVIDNPLKKSRQRLLLIVPWLRMGGADKWNLDLVEQLTGRGWEVTIAATLHAHHTWLPEFARYTPDIFCLGSFLRPAEFPVFLRYLIESREPDVVLISNSEMGYLALPYLRANCPGPLYVDYLHMEEPHWKNGGYPRYSLGQQSQLDLTMVTSDHLKRWMVQRGASDQRLRTVYINCDPQRWRPDPALRSRVRQRLGLSPGPDDNQCVILFAGRLTDQKQPRILARTLHEVARRGLDFTALIAGDGEERRWLEDYIAAHDLKGRVRLLGETSAAEVRELMGAADIFFLPSLWEGIALVMYEAMAAHLAFVGADVGGQRELATPESALLLPRADEQTEIAGYSSALAALISDPVERRAMGAAAGARIASLFTLDMMGDAFLEGLRVAREFRTTEPRQAVPTSFGHEVAVRAVEYMRTADQNNQLWDERNTLAAQLAAAPFTNIPEAAPHVDPVATELASITDSRAWRLLEALKESRPYRAYAHLRFGPGWNLPDPREPAPTRLARIKLSRSYRLIHAFKSSGMYQRYARKRDA